MLSQQSKQCHAEIDHMPALSANTLGLFAHSKAEAMMQHLLNIVLHHEHELSCNEEIVSVNPAIINNDSNKKELITQKSNNAEQLTGKLNY